MIQNKFKPSLLIASCFLFLYSAALSGLGLGSIVISGVCDLGF
jgi:hypothetical protein